MDIEHGAAIIIRDWVQLRARERLLIVSSRRYQTEADALLHAEIGRASCRERV